MQQQCCMVRGVGCGCFLQILREVIAGGTSAFEYLGFCPWRLQGQGQADLSLQPALTLQKCGHTAELAEVGGTVRVVGFVG